MLYLIGQQYFASIRINGFVYVDMTERLCKPVGDDCFPRRPRRFGKSLLAALEYYLSGTKERLEGLAWSSWSKMGRSMPCCIKVTIPCQGLRVAYHIVL